MLSTLEHDGSRRWLYPRLAKGRFLARRRVVAYVLIALYALLPFVKINGKPAILLDVTNRQFTFFGFTFLPTDTVLLAIFMVTLFLAIFAMTAIAGRVWCGWACPQTVYMEYVFRPIERLFYGRGGKGGQPAKPVAGWRKVAMYAVYLAVCLHLANMFLAYFIGVDKLHNWIWTSSPFEHPAPFALVMFVTGLMMFDFCFWREQLCIIGCPYGRFQSVMLDRSSLIVGYDERRGEPRGKGRDRSEKGLGDCVDCNLCVAVCPTGIDIRDGLQLECVGCAQCIDACDDVMSKIGLPQGLIRYSSQQGLDGAPTRVVRLRVIIYSTVILLLSSVFLTLLATKSSFDANLVREAGSTYVVTDSGDIANIYNLLLENRSGVDRSYEVTPANPKLLQVAESPYRVTLKAGEKVTQPIQFHTPARAFRTGMIESDILVNDDQGDSQRLEVHLLGPVSARQSQQP